MKLLKLVSSENLTESTFSNSFSIPLVLKPNTEVSLKSLTMEFDSPSFTIDDTNNQFSFRTKASDTNPLHVVNITNGKYNSITSLLKEIQNKMNNILDSKNENIPTDKYFQWRITPQESLLGNLNVFMEYKCSVPDINPVNQASAQLDGCSFTSGVFAKTASNTGAYNAVWRGIKPINKGGFQCSIKIDGGSNISSSNWVWGADRSFITKDLTTKDEIVAGMWFCMANSNNNYAYKKGLVMIRSSVTIEALDVLTVYKEDGKIKYSILKDGETVPTVLEGDVINESILNLGSDDGIMCFHYGDNAGLLTASNVFYTPDAFIDGVNGVYAVIKPENMVEIFYNSNLTAPPTNMKCTLFMPSVGIRRLLGFSQVEYSKSAIEAAFVSDNGGVSVNLIREDLEVEVLEMNFDCYTQTYKQKRNMIMSLSNADLRSSVIASGNGKYTLSWSEPANFTFIELENEHPQTYPQLTVRITSGGSPVEMSGKISCLFLHQIAK